MNQSILFLRSLLLRSSSSSSIVASVCSSSEMAFLLKNTSISSHLRSSSSQKTDAAFAQSRRGFHVELGAREKADAAMKSMRKQG